MNQIIKYVILIIPLYLTKVMNLLVYRLKLPTFILLVIFLFPNFVFAQNNSSMCSSAGYSILTVNGINTSVDGATENRDALKNLLLFQSSQYKNQKITVDFLYNKTHGKVIDSIHATNQVYFDQNSLNIQDSDFAQMLTDASAKVTTQKLFLVGHSQGNFYANSIYDAVADVPGGVPSISMGVYGVASPASRVAGNGLYITSDTDKMIKGIVAKLPFTSILPSNAHINFNNSDGDALGHGLAKIYLQYEGDRIVSNIKSSLDKLRNNNIQKENAPCLVAPKKTITQKVQSVALAVSDHTLGPVLDSAYNTTALTYNTLAFIGNTTIKIAVKTANTAYNTALTIGNKVIKVAKTVTSVISSLAKSLLNNSKKLAVNHTATVILADTKPSTVIAVTKPAIAKSVTISNSRPETPPPWSIVNNFPIPKTEETPPSIQEELGTYVNIVSPPSIYPLGGGAFTPPISSPPPALDTTPPVITILGENPFTVIIADPYTDAGATSLDAVNGNLTSSIVIGGTFVNTLTDGTFTITYTSTDSSSNTSTVTRTILVEAIL